MGRGFNKKQEAPLSIQSAREKCCPNRGQVFQPAINRGEEQAGWKARPTSVNACGLLPSLEIQVISLYIMRHASSP
jgi:hypothetical protein